MTLYHYKYDHKAAKFLRALRTEQQLEAWRRTSELFLAKIRSKKRLKSKQQRILEFQQYMDNIVISETSNWRSQEDPLERNNLADFIDRR